MGSICKPIENSYVIVFLLLSFSHDLAQADKLCQLYIKPNYRGFCPGSGRDSAGADLDFQVGLKILEQVQCWALFP